MVLQETKEKIIRGRKQHGSVVSYDNESTTITGGTVSDRYSEDFGSLLDEFLTYCVNHNPVAAYNLLSDECKTLMYQTEEIFESSYYREKFEGDKQYSFQSWSIDNDTYIYLVQIYDNMLATGNSKESGYIEDYITVVPDGDLYKINVNSYIGREDVYKQASNNLITAEVSVVDNYMEYKVYTIRLKNNKNERVTLDTRRNTNTTYITDGNGNKNYALLYGNNENDLILEPMESKTIQIRFNATYRNGLGIDSLEFDNIVTEQDQNTSNSLVVEF